MLDTFPPVHINMLRLTIHMSSILFVLVFSYLKKFFFSSLMKDQQNAFFSYNSPSNKLIVSPFRKMVHEGGVFAVLKKKRKDLLSKFDPDSTESTDEKEKI